MYDLSDPPDMSCTNLTPFFARTVLVVTPRQNPVSSQFQILSAKSLHGLPPRISFTSSKKSFTLSYHSSKFSHVEAFAHWTLRCWGFLAVRFRHLRRKHCHQSNPGATTAEDASLLWVVSEVVLHYCADSITSKSKSHSLQDLACYHQLFLFLVGQNSWSTCTNLCSSVIHVVCQSCARYSKLSFSSTDGQFLSHAFWAATLRSSSVYCCCFLCVYVRGISLWDVLLAGIVWKQMT